MFIIAGLTQITLLIACCVSISLITLSHRDLLRGGAFVQVRAASRPSAQISLRCCSLGRVLAAFVSIVTISCVALELYLVTHPPYFSLTLLSTLGNIMLICASSLWMGFVPLAMFLTASLKVEREVMVFWRLGLAMAGLSCVLRIVSQSSHLEFVYDRLKEFPLGVLPLTVNVITLLLLVLLFFLHGKALFVKRSGRALSRSTVAELSTVFVAIASCFGQSAVNDWIRPKSYRDVSLGLFADSEACNIYVRSACMALGPPVMILIQRRSARHLGTAVTVLNIVVFSLSILSAIANMAATPLRWITGYQQHPALFVFEAARSVWSHLCMFVGCVLGIIATISTHRELKNMVESDLEEEDPELDLDEDVNGLVRMDETTENFRAVAMVGPMVNVGHVPEGVRDIETFNAYAPLAPVRDAI